LGRFKNCELIWTPFSDHEEEGTFKNPFSGEVAATLPWYSNQPNGDNDENYVGIEVGSKQYWDFSLERKGCTPCSIPKSTLFHLFGLYNRTYFGLLIH